MEAILITAALLVLMATAVILLGRTWPRSSRLGGYRARTRDGSVATTPRDDERGEVPREDDDARWRWDDGRDDG